LEAQSYKIGGYMAKTIRTKGHETLVASLIAARQKAGLSQTELASRLRCHQSLVARIESGQRRIDVQELVILARALGADAGGILSEVSASVPDDDRI
jgi:transcriptional regulator with XRE-family HTH domain